MTSKGVFGVFEPGSLPESAEREALSSRPPMGWSSWYAFGAEVEPSLRERLFCRKGVARREVGSWWSVDSCCSARGA